MYLGRDQTPDDPGVKSLYNAWMDQSRFVVIIGKKYRPFPWSPGYCPQEADSGSVEEDDDNGSYAVLGWYRVKSCWYEYEPGKAGEDGVPLFIRWRFLFEWVAEQGVPWWLQQPRGAANPCTTMGAGDNSLGGDEGLSANSDQQAIESAPVVQPGPTTGTLFLIYQAEAHMVVQ